MWTLLVNKPYQLTYSCQPIVSQNLSLEEKSFLQCMKWTWSQNCHNPEPRLWLLILVDGCWKVYVTMGVEPSFGCFVFCLGFWHPILVNVLIFATQANGFNPLSTAWFLPELQAGLKETQRQFWNSCNHIRCQNANSRAFCRQTECWKSFACDPILSYRTGT